MPELQAEGHSRLPYELEQSAALKKALSRQARSAAKKRWEADRSRAVRKAARKRKKQERPSVAAPS